MSTPSPLQLTGSYTRELLSPLLRGIQEQKQSGVLHLAVAEREGTIHFMQGKLVAADVGGLGGVEAFQVMAASQGGRYEFKAGFVQFSQIGMAKRIHSSLESLLSSGTLKVSVVVTPGLTEVEPLAPFNLEAFDLDVLDDDHSLDNHVNLESFAATMPPKFGQALLSQFVRNVGPAGYVLLEEIALDLGIDLQAMSAAQAARLTVTILGQVPISKRSAFQSSCSSLLEQFKP